MVFLDDGSFWVKPGITEIAFSIGLNPQRERQEVYDVVIIGAGPAGLAAGDYRQLGTPGIAEFNGAGIYYGAAMTEATACKDKEVYIVGGGNSAGQEAMYLSRFAKNVYILIRKDDLTATMSAYLINQIEAEKNIYLKPRSEIAAAYGSDRIESLDIRSLETQIIANSPADALYIFIGAKPYTDWIELGIIKDEKGFVQTGEALKGHADFPRIWKQKREP
ncbi:NAD(P)/FAD-dependent oxidoreductase [Chitinophaga sp. CF418]|uniref:NAD(P)/FAD-dependent oxidoreductase n=1 Tax=Chitinophaga sp. CF418 TaxID=1855287 RepID=UPI00090F66F9|nr:FAD-dependent oxidoreductase [Chitinophaga sp. CF418]SHN24873.1 Pyridine nucleotide-disulphide oxidoreductase [Chitinophaga sp. CF418]